MENYDDTNTDSHDERVRDAVKIQQASLADPVALRKANSDLRKVVRAREAAEKRAERYKGEEKPFPLDALGPILKEAVLAIESKTMAPTELGVSSVLAAVALAAQSVANVTLRSGSAAPLSLYLLPIAETTERKSSVDGYAMAPVADYERELAETYAKLKPQYDIDVKVWRAQAHRILNDKNKEGEQQAIELGKLGPEPRAPLRPKLTFSNMTSEAMVKTFQISQPALGVHTAEGAHFLNGHAFTADKKLETLSILNSMWSGESYSKVTIAHGEQNIIGKRLAMHLMIQPHVAENVLNDDDMKVSGFTGRILLCRPPTRIGTRIWEEAPGPEVDFALGMYGSHLQSLFRAAEVDDKGAMKLRTLPLSERADELALEFYNAVERAQRPGGCYAKVKAQAGRAEEQARRIAGNLELFYCPRATTVTELNMGRGIAAARWYLNEALRIVWDEALADEVKDAEDILTWARANAGRDDRGAPTFSLRQLAHYGPGLCGQGAREPR